MASHTINDNRTTQTGSVLVEFAFVCPIIIFLAAAVVNIAVLLWETNLFITASRTAARDLVYECTTGNGTGFYSTHYANNNSARGTSLWEQGSFQSVSATYDDVTVNLRKFKIHRIQNNCRFCFGGYSLPEHFTLSSVSPYSRSCPS